MLPLLTAVSFRSDKRIREILANCVRSGDVAPRSGMVSALRHLMPAVEKAGGHIRSLADLNRHVHRPTYNQLIREEAVAVYAKLRAEAAELDRQAAVGAKHTLEGGAAAQPEAMVVEEAAAPAVAAPDAAAQAAAEAAREAIARIQMSSKGGVAKGGANKKARK